MNVRNGITGPRRAVLPDGAAGNAFAELERRGMVRRLAVRDGGSVVFSAQEIFDLLLLSERRPGSELLDTVAAPLRAEARRRTPPLPGHLRRR